MNAEVKAELNGCIEKGIPNIIRRCRTNMITVAPPFIAAIMTYFYAEQEHIQLQRKRPKDYENDE